MNRSLFWFREDLRVQDQPGLLAALQASETFLVYILDPHAALGQASNDWLTHSLAALNEHLDGALNIYEGACVETLLRIIKDHKISKVYWNQGITPTACDQDTALASALCKITVSHHIFQPNLLWDHRTHLTQALEPYKVFTPFYKSCRTRIPCPKEPVAFHPSFECKRVKDTACIALNTVPLKGLQLPGEHAAQECMQQFLASGLKHYNTQRNYPSKNSVSRLAPYLRFGELSVRTLWHAVTQHTQRYPESVETFCSELGWREFAYSLLHHFPSIPTQNYRTYFDHFPWEDNDVFLHAWHAGKTGYPLVDAGMRELAQTGYMHNRVRMVVASFLIKNLNIHWHHGRDWFWEHLYDADLANNSMNWQWVAGTGFDASPYIRIFNPTLQAERFDAEGMYIRHFIPELSAMPTAYLFEPWKAPKDILQHAQVQLGTTYPWPIIELAQSRAKALQAYAACQPPPTI